MTSMIIESRHYELFIMILNSPHLILLEILIEFQKLVIRRLVSIFLETFLTGSLSGSEPEIHRLVRVLDVIRFRTYI